MKRLSKFFAAFSFIELIGRHPVWAGAMTLLGAGGIVTGIMLTPPTILPQPSAAFSQSNSFGRVNMGLKPNGGTVGAFELPSTPTNSFAIYHEILGNGGWLFGSGNSATNGVQFFSSQLEVKRGYGPGWWLPTVAFANGAGLSSSHAGTGYNGGIYTWTAADGCSSANGLGAREPQGAVILAYTSQAVQVDPGFLCAENSSGQAPQVNYAAIPGVGATQTATVTSCASNTPVSGEYEITATVPVAHGLSPGMQFTFSTMTHFNGTFIAAAGTSATTLKGISMASGTCPASTDSGTLNGGSGNSVTIAAPSLTAPFSSMNGTGVQFKPNQRVCGMFGEFGADSSFPGGQFAKYTDITGTDLPGSPAVSPWLNQGSTNFTGYVVAGTQGAGTPALDVTAMNSYTVASASFSATTGYATFTMSQNPGFIVGSEFTVSGAVTTGGGNFNLTYVAVAGTSGTTIVGNPLSGPVGLPQTSSLTGSSTGSGGAMVGVIMPGMQILGAAGYILPFENYGGTGTGGVGTYGLNSNPGTTTFTVSAVNTVTPSVTVTGTPSPQLVVGTTFTLNTFTYTITALGTGTGGAGTYIVNTGSNLATGTASNTGAVGSSGSPVSIYAAETQYYSIAASSGPGGGTATANTQSGMSDFFNVIGTQSTIGGALTGNNSSGFGGNVANVGMFEGAPFPTSGSGSTWGPSSSSFDQLCTKTSDPYSWATAAGGSWRSLYKLNDGGVWADHSLAELTGYTTGASGTSGGTATLNVSTTPFGSLPGSGTAVLSGSGLCANSVCSTVNLATDVVTFPSGVTSANIGSSGSPIAISAGSYQPASIIQNQQITASISGNTLTVSAIPVSTSPQSATSTMTNASFSGTNTTNNFTVSSGGTITNTLAQGQCLWDGGVYIQPNSPLCVTNGSNTGAGPLSLTVNGGTSAFNYSGPIPPTGTETMYATAVSVVPGQYVLGAGITTPVQVTGYGTLTPCAMTGFPICGTYTISNPGALSVSSETMYMSGVANGGAIAPGAALTVSNPGLGVTYPIENWSALTGTMSLSGEYNVGFLGGTPSAIQAQISTIPDGPAVSGCTPCAWTNLSGSVISGGTWSGNVVNIPAGGPYWVALRAANGTSYATLPNPVFAGVNIAGQGEGNSSDQLDTTTATTLNQSYLEGFVPTAAWFGLSGNNNNPGANYIAGPPYLNSWRPSNPSQILFDARGIFPGAQNTLNDGALSESLGASAQLGGAPVGLVNFYKNGSGSEGNLSGVTQTQTIGLGTGSQTVYSSGAAFGGTLNTSGGAAASTMAAVTVSTAGVMTVPGTDFPVNSWSYLNIGEAVTNGTYSGVITGFGTGTGGGGTYNVSPSPGTAVASSTFTVTHNGLEFNAAWGSGAILSGTVASNVLTVNSMAAGALAPLMIAKDGSGNSATLTACLTNCSLLPSAQAGSTWQLSSGIPNETASFNVAPSGGALWPWATVTTAGLPFAVVSVGTGFNPIVEVGTFQVLVNGTVSCQDASTFAYNIQVGAISGSGCSGWVNYVTGSYAITFSSAPANNATIVAKWTNIMTTNSSGANEQIDIVGGSSPASGIMASVADETGGINANLNGAQGAGNIWPDQVLNSARQSNYYYNNQMAGLPRGQLNQPQLLTGMPNGVGAIAMLNYFSFDNNLLVEQYADDAPQISNFSGTISAAAGSGPWTATLTLSGAATGKMWEGEAVECNPFSTTCVLPLGMEIVSLASGTWGASGSTYNVTSDLGPFPTSGTCFTGSPCAMHNAMYYTPGNAYYVGPINDMFMQNGGVGGYAVETGGGMTGGLRFGQRVGVEVGAALSGHPEHGSAVTLDRTTFTGCSSGSSTSPCFDDANTYAASASATWSGSTFTITGALSAGNRPFVPGMALSCPGCNSGLFATAVSLPPTQSTATGAGQIGQTFTITASGTIGGGGTGTLTGGCSGTSGTGSNCIDFKFDINTTGTYSTPAALNTCGVNNLQGTNTNVYDAGGYTGANGQCVPTGAGSFVRGFRIGSVQVTNIQNSTIGTNLGSAYDFGMDPGNYKGQIVQNEAFTCNIVAATIVQCVKGPVFTNGVFSSVGKWSSGSTFASYGDPNNAFSFMSGIVGYPGGQAFPVTAGSGYSPAMNYTTGGVCVLNTGGGVTALAPAMGFTVSSGGAIIDPYPTLIGNSITQQCSFPISFTFTGVISGYNGTAHTANIAVTGITSGTGPGTIVPGEILTGSLFTGYATVVSGPQNGLNGTYVTSTVNSNITGSLASETITSGPTAGSGGSITSPPILWSTGNLNPDGIGGVESNDADVNMTGDGLYDNSGVSGNPLAGKFNTPAGVLEVPGLPVKPFGMRRGAGVSG